MKNESNVDVANVKRVLVSWVLTSATLILGCTGGPFQPRHPDHSDPSPSGGTSVGHGFQNQAMATKDPNEEPRGAAKSVDFRVITEEVKPRFDIRQTDSQIQQILADERPHYIRVLFDDELKVRVKQGAGNIRGKQNNNGISAGKRHSNNLKAIDSVLAKHEFSHIYPQYDHVSIDPDLEEVMLEQRAGIDIPNRQSYAIFKLASFDKQAAISLVKELNHLPGVKTAEIVINAELAAVSYNPPANDSYFPSLATWQSMDYSNTEDLIGAYPSSIWWWNRHSFGEAWKQTKGSGVTVAVIDNGFETDSTDGIVWDWDSRGCFFEAWWGLGSSLNVTWEDGYTGGDPYHGTHTSHLVGAADSNSFGLTGGAPASKIIPIKTGDVYYSSSAINLTRGLDYAVLRGAKVVNLSYNFGGRVTLEHDTGFRDAAYRAWNAGVTVVISAGNGDNFINYDPNIYTGAIVVGAVDKNNYRANFSNWGDRVDITAAGVDITAGSHNNGQAATRTPISGTSFASPLVAAAAALVKTYTISPAEVRDILIGTADLAWGNERWMESRYASTKDGIRKVRVLNAGAAVGVASSYDPNNPFTVYMPASDDYAQIRLAAGGGENQGWFPYNPMKNFPVGTAIQTWTYNSGGPWAGATSIFKNRRLWSFQVTGVANGVKADGSQYHPTYGNGDTSSGWKNGWQWTLN